MHRLELFTLFHHFIKNGDEVDSKFCRNFHFKMVMSWPTMSF